MEELQVFVGSEAFLEKDSWLFVRAQLWHEVEPKRDYVLCLPNASFDRARVLEATYRDAAALSRLLLNNRVLQGGCCRRPDCTGLFWTEHSARASLPSWADALGTFPQQWVDSLGPRGAKESEAYVRTQRLRAHAIQKQVGDTARSVDFSTEAFGEAALVSQLAAFRRENEVSEGQVAAVEQVLHFSAAQESVCSHDTLVDAAELAAEAQEQASVSEAEADGSTASERDEKYTEATCS